MDCDKHCACCDKKTLRSDEEIKKLINRLNRIEGQVRGIKAMVENDAYCADILIQSQAINAAINSFNKDLLNRHIHTCVLRDIQNGDENAVDELSALVLKLMK